MTPPPSPDAGQAHLRGTLAMSDTSTTAPARVVVLLCGPAGAGKTTAARASGLTVYDRDDPKWPDERTFTRALAQLRTNPAARAVVIRSGATSSARTKAAALIGATHMYLLTAPPAQLGHRVAHRGRADQRRGLAAIKDWHTRHDRRDGITDFPGWDTVLATTDGPPTTGLPVGTTSRTW